MNRPLNVIITAVLIIFAAAPPASAQTEGFNVKTAVEKISGGASAFLNGVTADAGTDPAKSIPKELVCESNCFIVIPSIAPVPGRDDFAGTGLLTCRAQGTRKPSPPLFYHLTNVESFGESGGGVLIFVTDKAGMKSALGDQLQLTASSSGAGEVGEKSAGKDKSFVAYVKPPGGPIQGFDPSGSTLVYASGDTFSAYQQDLDPVDVMLFGIDVPPELRGFAASVDKLLKGCE
ncbi:MAG: hypothetical protein IT344_01645 [Candidatus Dadabacteria bacterium]|nr:hypothetical protein [Candidatus Dadabacteria bacterium]